MLEALFGVLETGIISFIFFGETPMPTKDDSER